MYFLVYSGSSCVTGKFLQQDTFLICYNVLCSMPGKSECAGLQGIMACYVFFTQCA
jgi:hypothetical protein